ncbi:MAG: Fic family protein [Candidatus Korobacteraceae bacterium]
MTWDWQQRDWPRFRWDAARLAAAEQQYLVGGGILLGTVEHLGAEERDQLTVQAMSTEALTTSEIEGEILDRASVQSSIQRQLGLVVDSRRVPPREQGIAQMMVELYRTFAEPLSEATLFGWHRMVMSGRHDLTDVGRYRTSEEPMQIASGVVGAPKIHFEAPPSALIPAEMERFIEWFNTSAPEGPQCLPALTRAGTAHLYFESLHPFEDGNGRIGRAIAEKVLAQSIGRPTLIILAATMLARRSSYYAALEAASHRNEITGWLAWFAGITIEAQRRTQALIDFLIGKARLFDQLRGQLNERQEKALQRMFREGPEGFQGGLSAGKYASITKASPATATRDLADLTERGALVRTGERKHARYHLSIPLQPSRRVTVNSKGQLVEE